ncbi:hypothetical protein BDR03DRAFT_1036442 [Suillus americanus]|nr:hypothetical protein BDR03DRAFT_1036442 [Suillus americanus]
MTASRIHKSEENTQRARVLLAEAQLKVGPDHHDSTQYDFSSMDFEDDSMDAEATESDTISVLLFSEFYRTCTAQRECHAPAPWSPWLFTHPTTVAIHLECLELYHQICRHQSSFSIQSITRFLCALHNVTYSHTFRSQFTIVFDIYIQIQQSIQQRINLALDGNPADWHMNGQPDEPNLVLRRLHSMDGNHSAKRIDGSSSTDPDDVRNCPGQRKTFPNPSCADNWTTAKSHEEDKISVFEQTVFTTYNYQSETTSFDDDFIPSLSSESSPETL